MSPSSYDPNLEREVTSLLIELIKIDSISGLERKIADFICEYLYRLGFNIQKQQISENRYNIIAKIGTPKFYFNAHMDTVEPLLEIKEDKNYIYGRGACDTKSCIASMLIAGKKLINQNIKNFGYIFTVGEEVDFIGSKKIKELNLNTQFIIVGEPTELIPINGHYGILTFRLIFKGKSAHSSTPELGINAIEKAIKNIKKIIDKLNVQEESSLTLAKLNGGKADNIIPDKCEALFSMRISPKDKTDYLEEVRKIIKNNAIIEKELNIKPTYSKIPKELNFLGTGKTVKYCTDLSFLGKGLVLGPGSIKQAHGNNEFIKKEDLVKAIKLYERTGQEICSRSDNKSDNLELNHKNNRRKNNEETRNGTQRYHFTALNL